MSSYAYAKSKGFRFFLSIQLLIHTLIGILIGLGSLILINIDTSNGDAIYPLSLSLVALYFWCVWSWKKDSDNLFNPYILFLTSLMLFNAGQSFTEIFGLNEHGYLGGQYDYSLVTKSLLMVMLSIYTLHFGALIALNKKKNNASSIEGIKSDDPSNKALRTVGWTLFAISIASSVIMAKQAIGIVLTYGYFGLYSQKEIVTGFNNFNQVLATFLVPSALFMLAGSKGKRSTLYFSIGLICVNTLIQFFLGSRTYAAMPLVAYLWLYDCCIKKIPRPLLAFGGTFMLIVVFPLIHVVRDQTVSDKYSVSSLVSNYFSIDNPIVSIFKEMGGSLTPLAATIQVVPVSRYFDLGAGYFYAALTAIPNLFWDVHPSIAHGTYAVWASWVIDPVSAALGYGSGFSAIAEAFINFGWFGIFVFGLIGFGLTKFFHGPLQRHDYAKLAMVAVFLSYFLFFARSESNTLVRPLLWYACIPYVMYLMIRGHYRKKSQL